MKKMRFVGAILVLALTFACMAGLVPAKAGEKLILMNNDDSKVAIEPGMTVHKSLPVKTVSPMFQLSSLKLDIDSPLISASNIKLVKGDGREVITGESINQMSELKLEFDLTSKDSLKIGTYTATLKGKVWIDEYDPDAGNEEVILLTFDVFVPNEKSPIMLSIDSVNYNEDLVMPGSSFDLYLTVRNNGQTDALNVYVSLGMDEGLDPGYSVELHRIGDIYAGNSGKITIPVNVLSDCKVGQHTITANFTYKDSAGEEKTSSKNIYVNVKEVGKVDNAPFISLLTNDNYKKITPDSKDSVTVKIKNEGDADAKNVRLRVPEGLGADVGITKAFTSDYIDVGTIEPGKTMKVDIPFVVAKSGQKELTDIKIEVDYTGKDESAVKTAKMSLYLVSPEAAVPEENRDLITITGASHTPSTPYAGSNVTVYFTVNNGGTRTIRDFKIKGEQLSKANFEPISSNPETYVGDIEKGKSKSVSMTFRVGEEIPEGLNTLAFSYTYVDADGVMQNGNYSMYVLNVVNEKGSSIGKPKLIVDSWNVVDEKGDIHAGDVFDLNFSLLNTHGTKAAKNIKITLTQAEGIFAPKSGSNMFYETKIGPGERIEKTIQLKAKSTTATGDYDLVIKVEYEYDDMSDADKEAGGVTDDNTLKIHTVENYRPKIENLFVEGMDGGIYMGQEATLSFEFYNMGQSQLNNVFVTVEGDFALANNSEMSFVGTVMAGGQEYVSPSIIPLVSGEAQGTVVVHFEDSNGDEVTTSSNFMAMVEDFPSGDFGGDFYDPGFDPGFDMPEEEAAEPIMPVWAFILMLVAVLGLGTLITYKVIISSKKKKMRREADMAD